MEIYSDVFACKEYEMIILRHPSVCLKILDGKFMTEERLTKKFAFFVKSEEI